MLHTLRLRLPNVFLVVGKKAVLVDSGGPKDVPRILTFLHERGIDAGKLSLILLTHGHWDHAGGAAQLQRELGAPVALHRADADLARRGVNGVLKPTNFTARLIRPFVDRSFPPVQPDILFDTEMDLREFGVAARILFTPGHTLGSMSVLTDDGDVIVGDLLMGGWFGGWLFPTRPGLHYFADDLDQLRASVRKVLALSPRAIHPGHGGPLDPKVVSGEW